MSNADSPSFGLQNTQSTTLAPHEVTFGDVFADGQVSAGDQLIATINGVSYAVQLDVKTSYADGSVESGILTLDAPAIPANTTLDAVLSTTTTPAAPPVNIANLPGSGYNVVVDLTMQNANGTQTSYDLNAGTLLSQALAAGTATYWLQGPQATEVQFDVPISGSFHVTFDVTDFADGSSTTDVQFNNDDAMQATGGTVNYSETITQNGSVVSQQSNITQYQYQDWNTQFWSNGAPQVNVQQNILALEETGAIPGYDLSWSLSNIDPNTGLTLSSEAAAISNLGWDTVSNGTLPVDDITQYMPTTGGRPDIGPTTDATALWLITQNQTAAQYALGQANAAGSVPWNFFDPTTGAFASVDEYPNLWTDGRGGPASYTTGLTQQVATDTGWTPDPAHQPDLSYEAYLLTGNIVYLNDLNAQADFDILDDWPGYRDQGGYTDIVVNGGDQVRQEAWSLRDIDEAAYANPTGSAEKAYFTQVMDDNWSYIVSQLPAWTAEEGQAYGYLPGTYGTSTTTGLAPWEQDYFASTVVQAAEMGNQDAVQVLEWESNFLVGRFLNSSNGFDPNDGYAYNLIIGNGTSLYQTWGQIEAATQAAGDSNGSGYAGGDYAELALESLAGIITVDSMYPSAAPITSLAAAMQAYGWILASAAGSDLRSDAQFQIAPRLPDGNYLDQSNIQVDTSSNNLTLTTTPGADSLIHAGGGNDTLVAGNGTTDLLFGGTGNDVFEGSTGSTYMFGGTGTNTFVAGTGNDYMQGAGKANTYVFNQNNTGQDTIANFNVATDAIDIAGVAFSSAGTAMLQSGNVLQVKEDGLTLNFQLDPSQDYSQDIFKLSPDGASGISITASTPFVGAPDILWFDPGTGDVGFNDGPNAAWHDLGGVPLGYTVAGIGDFGGNNTLDILWFDPATGDVGYNDGPNTTWHDLGSVPSGYTVAGVGDFGGNNTLDILWFNSATGDVGYNDGPNAAWHDLGGVPLGYTVAGIGDFGGNNTLDILWFDSATGDVGYNDGPNTTWHDLGSVPSGYTVAGVGDFGGNNTLDILWFDPTTGDVGYNDGPNTTWHDLGSVPSGYAVAGVGDFNGNGKTDILWYNAATGDVGYNDGPNTTWHDLGFAPTAYHVTSV